MLLFQFQPVDPEDDKGTRFPKFNKQLQSLQKQIGSTGEKSMLDYSSVDINYECNQCYSIRTDITPC